MANVYSVKAVVDFIQTMIAKEKVTGIRVGKIDQLYFNDMEGYNYNASINVITPEGYRNRRVTMRVNSTYLQDWETEEAMNNKDVIQGYFNNMLI